MPQVDHVNSHHHLHHRNNSDLNLVVNDEDILLSSGKRRNSFEAEAEVDSGFSKSNSPTDSVPQGSVR